MMSDRNYSSVNLRCRRNKKSFCKTLKNQCSDAKGYPHKPEKSSFAVLPSIQGKFQHTVKFHSSVFYDALQVDLNVV